MARISRDHLHLFFDHGVDIGTKTIYMGTEIDEALASNVIRGLHILSKIRPDDPISLLINCEGGDIQHGLAILDTIRSLSTRVNATVLGHCHSMATWVLQGCDHRAMSPNSSIMIHAGEGVKDKYGNELDRRCNMLLLGRIREKNPGYTQGKLDRLLETDTYIWPAEALELGLIDEIK